MKEQKHFKAISDPEGKLLFKWDSEENIIEIVKKRRRINVRLKRDGGYEIQTKTE